MANKKTTRSNHRQFAGKLRKYPSEALAVVLAIAGLILSFFFARFGAILVGLGVGLCFFEEIVIYLRDLTDYLRGANVYRTIVWIVAALFLLLSLPTFIIFVAIGCLIKFIYLKAVR